MDCGEITGFGCDPTDPNSIARYVETVYGLDLGNLTITS